MEVSTRRLFSLSIPRTILLLLHYFVCYCFLYRYIASYITIQIEPHATLILPSIQWTIYIVTAAVTVLLAWPSLKNSYRRLKENLKNNLKTIALMSILLIVVNLMLSIIVALFTQTTGSNNQEQIREASNAIPFITLFATCIAAPFVEECVFRCGAFAFLRRKAGYMLSAIVSSILFASIHFIDSAMSGNFADLSYLIVYFGLGMVLSYSYEKSDSVAVSFSVHFVNNALSMLMMFL